AIDHLLRSKTEHQRLTGTVVLPERAQRTLVHALAVEHLLVRRAEDRRAYAVLLHLAGRASNRDALAVEADRLARRALERLALTVLEHQPRRTPADAAGQRYRAGRAGVRRHALAVEVVGSLWAGAIAVRQALEARRARERN